MRRTAVLDVVGLTPCLIGPHTPFLAGWMAEAAVASLRPVLPAVTCSMQASMLTGLPPSGHGIPGNGWYDRCSAEIRFWRQSSHLVQAPRVWDAARAIDPGFTCANLFWWFAMYAATDIAVTPRPMYPADGRKIPDVWTSPPELRQELQRRLGQFPLFEFWGPRTTIRSSRWIAEAAKLVEAASTPGLSLVYLPHLDYALQRLGPEHPGLAKDLAEIDALCADLVGFYEARGVQVILLSEYGIAPVSQPVHLNRVLREHGFLTLREELGRELLDAGASAAFAVADHQVAHVHVKDRGRLGAVRALLERIPGVEAVLEGLGHPRAGDLVAIAAPGAWFTYYYWLEDRRAPDFARTVEIHRKPGYDPVELFLDPAIRLPAMKIAGILARRALGFRTLMDVIPLDASLVHGSHGRLPETRAEAPLLATRARDLLPGQEIDATAVHDLILAHLFGQDALHANGSAAQPRLAEQTARRSRGD
ncbi:alkaline phosphatase family protein [Siccirubricoccus sp. G192]|nr:alkaline phosphatase family protein [Siccirubricoccus sp. G192]